MGNLFRIWLRSKQFSKRFESENKHRVTFEFRQRGKWSSASINKLEINLIFGLNSRISVTWYSWTMSSKTFCYFHRKKRLHTRPRHFPRWHADAKSTFTAINIPLTWMNALMMTNGSTIHGVDTLSAAAIISSKVRQPHRKSAKKSKPHQDDVV